MADAARLKSAVYRATNDAGDGEGDPAAMVEVDQILKDHPELIMEGVKYIKARIKDKDIRVSLISLNLLDQCMQSNGFQFQVYVIKKVLQRVLKNAYYGKGTQANVQQKCASLIRQWAASYGTDARMKDFVDAKRDLDRQEEKAVQRGGTGSTGHTPPLRSQRAMSPGNGIEYGPNMVRSPTNRPSYGAHGMLPPFPNIDPAMLAAMDSGGPRSMGHLSQINIVDIDQARENLALLSQMMSAETGDVRSNEVLAEVATLCKACQAGIMGQIESIDDEARLSEFLALNDRLSDELANYEKALSGQTTRVNRVLEADTTMSDGRAMNNTASPSQQPPPPPPAYNEEDELARALAESAKMAKDKDTMNELSTVFGGGDHVPDVTQVNYTRENYGESNASAINQRQVRERDAELNDLFGKSNATPPPPPAAPARQTHNSASVLDELSGLNFGESPSMPSHTVATPPPQAAQALRNATTGVPTPPVDDPFLALSNASSPPPLPVPPAPAAPPRANASPPEAASASTMPLASTMALSSTGGASAEQINMWFARLSANREGVLFEDSTVQIGVKTQYQGNQGRVQLYVGNKSSSPLTDFAVSVSWVKGTSGMLTLGTGAPVPPTSVVEPRQQMQVNCDVVAGSAFEGAPPLFISYTCATGPVRMDLKLPVVASKFVEASPMSKSDFDSAWGKLLFSGEEIVIQSSDKWLKLETLRALLSNGIHLGLVESETETCFGSGKFKGAEAEKHVMVIAAANAAAKTVSLSVRAESSELRLALESQLSLLLSAKK